MVVYWSILVFTTAMGYITNLKTQYFKRGKERFNIVPKSLAIFTFSLLIYFVGIRTYVMDTGAYIAFYNRLPTGNIWTANKSIYGFETGFVLFSMFIKKYISTNPNVWLMIIAIVCGGSIISTLRKYSLNFGFSSYLFIATTTFTWMMNGMRQFICVSIFFYFIDWIIERKTVKFILLTLLLSYIHFSCLIMIPVYFIVQCKPWDKRFIIIIIILGFIMLFTDSFLNLLSTALFDTPYSGMTEAIELDKGMNPVRVLVSITPLLLAFIFRNKLLLIESKSMNLSINMCFIGVVIYVIGTVTSGILVGRMPIYFSIYSLILIPNTIEYSFEGSNKLVTYMIVFICYLAYFYYQMYIAWGGLEYFSIVL